MNIWRTRAVNDEPQIVLTHWSVRELPDGDRHFVGYNISYPEGRVSSKILEFDPETMRGKTRSGRVYQLDGKPGYHGDAEYVWGAWKRINKVESYQDVTEEIYHGE
jgi:hypothetical protein